MDAYRIGRNLRDSYFTSCIRIQKRFRVPLLWQSTDVGLVDSDNDIVDHHDEDMMADVELWQQLESELYQGGREKTMKWRNKTRRGMEEQAQTI